MRLLVLILLLVILPGLFTAGVIARNARGGQGGKVRAGDAPGRLRGAFPGARGSQGQPRSPGTPLAGWLAFRRLLRLRQVELEHGLRRDEFRSRLRMREQAEKDRRAAAAAAAAAGSPGAGSGAMPGPAPGAPGSAAPGTGPGPAPAGEPPAGGSGPPPPRTRWRAAVTHVWPNRRPWGDLEAAGPAEHAPGTPVPAGSHGPAPQPPGPVTPYEPPVRPAGIPPASRPAPGLTAVPTIEGVVVTIQPDTPGTLAVPGVEMIIEGAAALRRYAMAGNVQAKRRAVLGTAVAAEALAGTVRALAREMAEPGQHYGPEVTDPLTMTAVHFMAASGSLGEIDGRLLAITRAAEELRASGVQAPHHEQMADH